MKRKVVLPYNPKLKEVARRLRKSGILSEVLLWRCLKRKQLLGYDFDRQKPIDNYIVDFFCNELMLAIEIDGISHENKGGEDGIRQSKLESLGVRFLRFYDSDVKKNIQGVLWVIENWIKKHATLPTPNPSQEGNIKVETFQEGNEEERGRANISATPPRKKRSKEHTKKKESSVHSFQ